MLKNSNKTQGNAIRPRAGHSVKSTLAAPWQPGQSGNPAGRKPGIPNKATAAVKEAAQVYTAEALRILVAIMRDKKEAASARVSAAKEILDRGHGKTPQAINMAVSGFDPARYLAGGELDEGGEHL
jgi:hypothetical protein